jgi:hypothetical protein
MTTELPIHLQSALADRPGRPRQLTLPGQAAAPDGARDRVLDLTGPAYRGIWMLTRGGFARRDRRAMRHV